MAEGDQQSKGGWWQKPVAVIAGVTAILGALGGFVQALDSPLLSRLVDRLMGETPVATSTATTSAPATSTPGAQTVAADPHWIADARTGCAVYNAWPQPNEAVEWSGPCVEGRAEGPGVLVWFQDGQPTGLRYEGAYVAGKRDGAGVETMWEGSDEAVYAGAFSDNNRHGQGKLTWVDRSSWEGPFAYGLPNGWGKFTAADGKISERQYVNGNFMAER